MSVKQNFLLNISPDHHDDDSLVSGCMQIRPAAGPEAGLGLTSNGSAQPGPTMGQHSHPASIVMSSGSQQENGGHGGQAAEVRDRQNGTNKQPVKKTSTTSRNNGYRAKELAKIKNGLQPFEKAESPGVRIPVTSLTSVTSELGLRTVSSLSTESSTNSVCSDGFSSVQEALQKLNNLGYDEVCWLLIFVILNGILLCTHFIMCRITRIILAFLS